VDELGNVYVTGFSADSEMKRGYATIKYGPDGSEMWVARYDSGWYDDAANALAVDGSGNVYVTGNCSGFFTVSSYCTIKYDNDGNELWIAHYNPIGVAQALAVDGSGNVYVTGHVSFYGTVDDYDFATIKYDSDGNELWVASYDGPASSVDVADALAVDGSGNVYVTGRSDGSGTGFDYATIKYDSDGNELWAARYDGPASGRDWPTDLAVDGSGNAYVAGYSTGRGTDYDYATIKYDSDGNELWVARHDGPASSNDLAYALAVDGWGNVYVTGFDTSGSGYDYATIKYDTDGNQQWVAKYNAGQDYANEIAVDASGNVYVTGSSQGSSYYDYATIKYSQYPFTPTPTSTFTPTPTPTATRTPTPTSTVTPTPTITPESPPSVGGTVKIPPAAIAAEAHAAAEGSGWTVGAYAALASVGAAVAVAVGGWCTRRRWRARRAT
jgi:hypothetical protein